jgi:CheY-like chemotaxis protein
MGRGGYYSVDSLGGVYVLVVDNDAGARAMLTSVLQYCGALVTAVGSELEALDCMAHVKPDVLVVSLSGVDGEGHGLVHRVRALKPEDGGVVPIVVVSERRPEQTGRGFDAHLPRPFDPWALCRLVSQLVVTGEG